MEAILNHPALLVKEKKRRILVFSDLHIGWEGSLAEQGLHIPSQIDLFLNRIYELINLVNPTSILILGDIKQTIRRTAIGEWREVPLFFQKIHQLVSDILIIPGNHDGSIESLIIKDVKILPKTGYAVGDTGFVHGHAWFSVNILRCRRLVIGHIHPVIESIVKGNSSSIQHVWVKAKIDPEIMGAAFLRYKKIKVDGDVLDILKERFGVTVRISQLIIMPSFNDFIGGYSLNKLFNKQNHSRIFQGPILRSGSIDILNAELHLLDGSYLGKVRQFI